MLNVLLKYFLSPLITASLGFCAGLYLERHKDVSAERKVFLEHRMKVWSTTATSFPNYIAEWRRLRTIAAKGPLTELEQNRKNGYVQARDVARHDLLAGLEQAKYLFSASAKEKIEEFIQFDDAASSNTLEELPPINVWQQWEGEILSAVTKEVNER
jgi:hypothetical protein